MAVGDAEGTVSLVQLSDSLAVPQANERAAIAGMFERETKREKNLNANQREIEARRQRHARNAELSAEQAEKVAQSTTDKTLQAVDAAFTQMMRSW
jgi:dynein intermediate chain 2|tara:strand:+ start:198 stop:485 length:288 start_codon:yes stop_codon:yes gene_type:complete